MRGGFLHNRVLVEPLDNALRQVGTTTKQEFAVRIGGTIRYVDLFAEYGGRRWAIEAETSAKRIDSDLRKAEALKVDELWIVVPNTRVGREVRRKLARLPVGLRGGRVFVLTQGQARQRITNCLLLIAGA